MDDHLESAAYQAEPVNGARPPGWMKVGVVAVASALAGGLAAAWFYRKTLARLRAAEEEDAHSEYGISDYDPSEEI